VLLDDGDGQTYWCFAGDAAFTEQQIWRGELAGIVQDAVATRRSSATLRRLMEATPTIFLPSHDPESPARLKARQVAKSARRL
jgi:glyoxylase-like metal-dependent hydrolase (beta-lactamase superfamily II)